MDVAGMDQVAARPIHWFLIINDHIGLRQERREAVTKPEFFRTRPGIVSATGTPAVENRTLRMQITNMLDDGWDRYALRANVANDGVVDVHVHMDG